MNLIKSIQRKYWELTAPRHNFRELIPGWDDGYPDPIFNDDWSLTSESDYDLKLEDFALSHRGCIGCKHFNEINNFGCDIHGECFAGCSDFEDDFDLSDDSHGFTQDETEFINLTRGCWDCKYYHGVNYGGIDLICGMHPQGNKNCLDFESKYDELY